MTTHSGVRSRRDVLRAAALAAAALTLGTTQEAWAQGTESEQRLQRLMERLRAAPAAASAAVGASAPGAGVAADDPRRLALMQQGEAALAAARVGAALRAFEEAALMHHAADTEMGIVRSYMQAGEYRRALIFAAHTSGAHVDKVSGRILYAWLLHLGGQPALAQAELDKIGDRIVPLDKPLVEQARQLMRQGMALAPVALQQAPMRLAPYPSALGAVAVPEQARVQGAALLLTDRQHALWPQAVAAEPPSRLWLRDGLGRAVGAVPVKASVHEGAGLVVLKLETPLGEGSTSEPAPPRWSIPGRDPFPGSAGLVAGFVGGGEALAAWPFVRTGFLGMPEAARPALRRLGIDVPPGQVGGPVFDGAGRIVGLALAPANAPAGMLPLSALQRVLADALGASAAALALGPVSSAPASQRLPVDEVVENSLHLTLQVILAA